MVIKSSWMGGQGHVLPNCLYREIIISAASKMRIFTIFDSIPMDGQTDRLNTDLILNSSISPLSFFQAANNSSARMRQQQKERKFFSREIRKKRINLNFRTIVLKLSVTYIKCQICLLWNQIKHDQRLKNT